MTADLDLSPKAVERLAAILDRASGSAVLRSVYLDKRDAEWCAVTAAATLRALAAENTRLRAEDEASAHDIARLKDSETHWLNEADRLRSERDASRQAGAEAMREAASRSCVLSGQDLAEGDWGPEGRDMAVMLERRIRALPLPEKYKGGE